MTATDRLAQIQARVDKTTPGVWKIWGMQVMADQKGTSVVDDAVPVAQTYLSNDSGKPRTFDAQFIAQAHQDVPALVAAVRAVDEVTREHRRRAPKSMSCECLACQSWRAIEAALGEGQ